MGARAEEAICEPAAIQPAELSRYVDNDLVSVCLTEGFGQGDQAAGDGELDRLLAAADITDHDARPQANLYAFFVRSGVKPIEFEKGKTAIAVPSLDKLPSVIDTLINAVKSGELDS